MPLIHGQNIGASQVEREVSSWDAERFARLCNSVAWATTWHAIQGLPAFTERVLVSDNGIDAERSGDIAPGTSLAGQFIRAGTNVFQFKKREVAEQTRAKIVSTLVSNLRGAVADVERRTGKTLSSYVLFTNIDLLTDQQSQLRAAIRHDLGERRIHVEVVGAAELAAMLNNLPHLRSAFFSTLAFQTWGRSWDAHQSVSIFAEAPLIGRERAVGDLAALLQAPDVRVVALTGTHMMGKSRVALEATRLLDASFVEAIDRH
jgi:hypothetical protein